MISLGFLSQKKSMGTTMGSFSVVLQQKFSPQQNADLKKTTLNQVLIILEPPFLTIKVIRTMPATNTAEYEVAMMHSCRMYKQMTNTPSCTL